QALEAVDAGHLFDQVFFDFNVETVRGRHHAEDRVAAFPGKVEAIEDAFDLGLFDRHTQHPVAALQAHLHRLALGKVDALVVDGAGLAAADLLDETGNALEVAHDVLEIDSAFEAMAGFRAELVAPRLPHDGVGPPECRLDVDVGGVQRDRGGFAAHDAGHAFHYVAGGDNAHVGS